jgi:hypothetical protein
MIPLIDKPRQYEFNRRIIEKSHRVIFFSALVIDPVFSPANGQFIISTRRGMTCRGLLAVAFDRARHCASNGLNIVVFAITRSVGRRELRLYCPTTRTNLSC